MTNSTHNTDEAALAEFTEYFVKNYPGPDTIIGDPLWHAPKIFRAAKHALSSTAKAGETEPEVWIGEWLDEEPLIIRRRELADAWNGEKPLEPLYSAATYSQAIAAKEAAEAERDEALAQCRAEERDKDDARVRAIAAEGRFYDGKDVGADFVLTALGKAIGAEDWHPQDGSEEWEGDVRGTLYSILRLGKVLDPETDELATVCLETAEAQVAVLREALNGLKPSHLSPADNCWCRYGWDTATQGHTPQCLSARAALPSPSKQPGASS